ATSLANTMFPATGRSFQHPCSSMFAPERLTLTAMKIAGRDTRTIWLDADGWSVGIIDQTQLPHRFSTVRLASLADAAHAIAAMQVRGAPLIGATAAYGMCLA